MPCVDGCGDARVGAGSGYTVCSGALKAMIGTCHHPTDCAGVNYPVGHFVRVNDYPSKGIGNYVYAYYADNCADKLSEVGLLGAEQCQLKRGVSVQLKQMNDSALFYGAVVTANGVVPGSEIKIGYTDPDGRYWTMWSAGTDGGATGFSTGEFDLNGLLYTAGIAAAPTVMPDNGIYGSVIGAGNDNGTSVGILYATTPGSAPDRYNKIAVYGSAVYDPSDTDSAIGGYFGIRDPNGLNVAGTQTVLGYAVGNVRRAAMFDGRISISSAGQISRTDALVGEVYLDGETLKVRLS